MYKRQVSSEEVAASLEAGAQIESIYRPLSATEGEKGVLMDKLEEKSEAQEQLLNRLTSVSYTHLDVYKRQFLDRMGAPDRKIPAVHVAGTN